MSHVSHFVNLAMLSHDLVRHYLFDHHKPSVFVWSITNRCNLDCGYCGLPRLNHEQELSGKALLEYLDMALDEGLRVLSLTGGEPMVSPHFEAFVERARSRGVWVSVNSNGVLVPKKIDFIKRHVQQVLISLDGPVEINDLHRGNGSAAKAMEAIQAMREAKVRFTANCVLTHDSIGRLPEIIAFSQEHSLPISYQLVFATDLTGSKPLPNAVGPIDAVRCMDELLSHKRRFPGMVLNSESSLRFVRDQFLAPHPLHCRAGELFMRVEPNGDIRKCGRVGDVIPYSQVKERGLRRAFLDLQEFKHCTTCLSQIAIKANFKGMGGR